MPKASQNTEETVPRESHLALAGITQQLDPSMWNWTATEKVSLYADASAIGAVILARVEAANPAWVVESLHVIIHDKDTIQIWNGATRSLEWVDKPKHIHAVIRFARGSASSPTLSQLARAVGVAPQYIEKAARGNNAYSNMLSYLIHIKYLDKFQYKPDEVATIRGEDYLGIFALNEADWITGRRKIVHAKGIDADELFELCFSGQVTMGQIMLTDDYRRVFALNETKLLAAMSTFGAARAFRAAQALERGDFSTQVIYVTGAAGAGKTRAATDLIAKAIQESIATDEVGNDLTWACYKAASTNPLDDYQGEEILLLDDLRGNSMSASDWLKLLDPYNTSPMSARYRNKPNVAPRLIVITSTQEPAEFFFFTKGRGVVDEALDQFLRRLRSIIRVIRTDSGTTYELEMVGRTQKYAYKIALPKSNYGASHEFVVLEYGAIARAKFDTADEVHEVLFNQTPKLKNGRDVIWEITANAVIPIGHDELLAVEVAEA